MDRFKAAAEKSFDFNNPGSGVPMRVVYMPIPDRFGKKEARVMFYDLRRRDRPGWEQDGQLVGGYFATALLAHTKSSRGLLLNYCVPQWTVEAPCMAEVRAWLAKEMA